MATVVLLKILERLGKNEFEKFKWYLSQDIVDDLKPIPKRNLDHASCMNTVTLMKEHLGAEQAVSVAVDILKLMNKNASAEELEEMCDD